MLSSAAYNGGLKEADALVNIQVPMGCGENKNDVHWSPEEFIIEQVQKLNLQKDRVVGLMTAANVSNVSVFSEKYGETTLTVFATAGATVAVTAGEPAASKNQFVPGTINIVVIVDGNMTEGCLVDAVKTVTEAKTVAIRELDIRSRFSGDLATGTLTDSVAIGCTKKGELIQYAGTFTLLGELIGKCVRDAVKTAMKKQEGLTSNRSLIERLADRGITPEVILSLIENSENIFRNRNSQNLRESIERVLSDPKVASLVLASLHLDEDLARDMIPAGCINFVDVTVFEEIAQNVLQNFKKQISKENVFAKESKIGPYTQQVFLSIFNSL